MSSNEVLVLIDPLQEPSESCNEDDTGTSSGSDENFDPLTRRPTKKRRTLKMTCSKLTLPDHFAAYMEERDLNRDVEPVQCSEDIIENIFSNYVILKNILSHLQWQDKLVCKDVGSLWNSAINRLQTEQLSPVDFCICLAVRSSRTGIQWQKSSDFYTEPMAVFVFCNAPSFNIHKVACKSITPSPCAPVCDMDHSILDIIYQETTAPRDCMYALKAYSLGYLPLQESTTFKNYLRKPPRRADGYFCGIYIPKIPGVEFKIIDINNSSDVEQDMVMEIKKFTETYVIKGVIACLTDNYLLYVDEENAQCLGFLQAMQPDIPFAFGGCLVEDTAHKEHDLVGVVDSVNKKKDFVTGNTISLGLFVVPKVDTSNPETSSTEPKHNFEAYSFVIDSTEWSKLKIQLAIQEFSKSVPRFEYSVALKFSCMGREHKHDTEQSCFRRYFPKTRILACFGNGELGISHPKRKSNVAANKRAREDVTYDKVHSYSTVFFYIGWGKITEEAECDN